MKLNNQNTKFPHFYSSAKLLSLIYQIPGSLRCHDYPRRDPSNPRLQNVQARRGQS